eukprot:COSAG02_NODE_607_length_19608_cov_33.568968_12_plen_104_part_00
MTQNKWLTLNIEAAETLLEELYYERDCGGTQQQPELEQRMRQLLLSVYNRRYYASKLRPDREKMATRSERARQHYRRRLIEARQQLKAEQAQRQTEKNFTLQF